MPEQLTRLKLSNLPVICTGCGREFRAEAMNQHTRETGHENFYPKPISVSKKESDKRNQWLRAL
jgi:hypothetical protein